MNVAQYMERQMPSDIRTLILDKRLPEDSEHMYKFLNGDVIGGLCGMFAHAFEASWRYRPFLKPSVGRFSEALRDEMLEANKAEPMYQQLQFRSVFIGLKTNPELVARIVGELRYTAREPRVIVADNFDFQKTMAVMLTEAFHDNEVLVDFEDRVSKTFEYVLKHSTETYVKQSKRHMIAMSEDSRNKRLVMMLGTCLMDVNLGHTDLTTVTPLLDQLDRALQDVKD